MRTVLLGSSKSEPLEIQAHIRWPCDRPPERLGRLVVRRQAGSRDGRRYLFSRASANRQISVQNSGKEIPTAAAALGSRLPEVIPGNVFASRHQIPPCGSRRKSTGYNHATLRPDEP